MSSNTNENEEVQELTQEEIEAMVNEGTEDKSEQSTFEKKMPDWLDFLEWKRLSAIVAGITMDDQRSAISLPLTEEEYGLVTTLNIDELLNTPQYGVTYEISKPDGTTKFIKTDNYGIITSGDKGVKIPEGYDVLQSENGLAGKHFKNELTGDEQKLIQKLFGPAFRMANLFENEKIDTVDHLTKAREIYSKVSKGLSSVAGL